MTNRLQDKTAIVVGAGQSPGEMIGNGRATAVLFAREGADVHVGAHGLIGGSGSAGDWLATRRLMLGDGQIRPDQCIAIDLSDANERARRRLLLRRCCENAANNAAKDCCERLLQRRVRQGTLTAAACRTKIDGGVLRVRQTGQYSHANATIW